MRSLWSAAAGGVTVLVMAVGMLATGSGLTSASAPAATTPRTITITGSGSVSATPDEATVTLGVTAQASDAQTALTHDSQQMNAVVTALEHTGIAAKDIQTSELQLNPQYPNGPSASHTITGFVATNTVQATVHDTSKLGNAIDAALQAGANTINGVNFSISNEAAVQNKAYQQAVADARSAAQAIASAAGVQISGIQSISESSNCCVRPVFAAAAVAAPASTPVFAGQQQVSVSLQVVFDIAS